MDSLSVITTLSVTNKKLNFTFNFFFTYSYSNIAYRSVACTPCRRALSSSLLGLVVLRKMENEFLSLFVSKSLINRSFLYRKAL